MVRAGMGACDKGVQAFDLVREPVLHQEIESAIGDRRLRSEAFLAQAVQNFVGTEPAMLSEENFQGGAPNRSKSQFLLGAKSLGRHHGGLDTMTVIMVVKRDSASGLVIDCGCDSCHVITFPVLAIAMLYNHGETSMSRNLLPLSLTATLLAGTAMAEVPRVAVDIAPVHSLVTRVMGELGTPDLIIPPGASPHEYSLRPSEAAALQEADLVIWMGEDLAPWLDDAVGTLAVDASVTGLLEADGTVLLDFRESALFEAHDHGHDDEHEDHDDHGEGEDHDHGDHEDHAEDDHDDHDDHDDLAEGDHGHDDHAHDDHDHAHGDYDPHAWLSPENAATWLNVIAAQLSAADPDNAGAYFANAAEARAELDSVMAEVNGILDPVRGGNFIVFHDAYQYFESAFDFPASGAISLGDATDPSPARVAEIQARVADENIACVLSEPQFNPGLVASVMDGTEARTAVLDPLGSSLEPGETLYEELLRNLANELADCLS